MEPAVVEMEEAVEAGILAVICRVGSSRTGW
jgi:protein-tyrosine phosphatase